MRGDSHVVGGLLVQDKLKLPLIILYLMIKPSFVSALIIYVIYDSLMTTPTRVGAVLADYDHGNDSAPNIIREPWSGMLMRFLKAVGATHRSVHTHNVDLNIILFGTPPLIFLSLFMNTREDLFYILFLYLLGYTIGMLSHQFLDMLTVMGVNTSFFRTMIKKGKFTSESEFRKYQYRNATRIIPHRRTMYEMEPIYIGKMKTFLARPVPTRIPQDEWYKTGGGWENEIVRRMMVERFKSTSTKKKLIDIVIILLIFYTLTS